MLRFLLVVCLLIGWLSSIADAQTIAAGPRVSGRIRESTVANLPSPAPPSGTVYIVTDGNTTNDCTTGGGTNRVFCEYSGAAWASLGDGAGGGDDGSIAGLDDDDHLQYVVDRNAASTPGAGSCTRAGEMYTDTTTASTPVAYVCGGAGETPRNIGAQGDAYNQVSDGSTSASAVGSETLQFTGGTGITATVAAGSPDDLDISITNHVKSIAPGVSPVGVCTITEEALAASKPTDQYVTCTDIDTDQINFSWPSPDSWNAGTVTVEIQAVNINASPSGNLVMHCSGDSVGNDDIIPNQTTTGQQAATITFATQYDLMHATTTAITLNGTPVAGDTIFMHCDIDATLTTTTQMTDVRIMPRPKVEYTVTGGGSD